MSLIGKLKVVGVALISLTLSHQIFAQERVTVFAASSMTDAVNKVVEQYKAISSDDVIVSYAGSSSLARQVSQGAPADIFISANDRWMDYVIDQKAVDANSRKVLVKNSLAVISGIHHSVSPFKLSESEQWLAGLNGSRLVVADPNYVPAGIYAKQSLQSEGVWQTLSTRLASANNVRAALALVERGESPLGIVYTTDALISKKVNIVATFPESSHSAIEYPMALVSHSPSKAATNFYRFLLSKQAKATYKTFGFKVVQ
ncbi:molybdate ABC transporter substrate-binding protein [Vibrio sp. SS-MA-C1-2]|uniref:molybdate ABC transporter substrate-binding protein n=1 Tax=Vibrio sp. SS-MA-C1-2 TaxID=2908646 RepID=UPI001F35675A|nr:molybdate ABC transporter substrate-binding protein [Vibrio sp. SS-MA-C1-2]UJF17504.1 molybdate ABC transporter substrate-binding protein [Vibrio sp. SS-MA-C1-2]